MCCADFGVLQSPSFCKLLGAVIVSWSSPHSIAMPAELQPLTSLTGLTDLSVSNGTNLGDMTELRHLQYLSSLSLHKCSALSSKAVNFTNLQSLYVTNCQDEILDFSSCSSLTQLTLKGMGHALKQVVLPCGPKVMLQTLEVGDIPFGKSKPEYHYVMANMGMATQLTEVNFMYAYPSNFRDGEWPLHLPNLHNLELMGLSCDLPSSLTSCSGLQRLAVTDHEQDMLPLWMSSMTQLSSLKLRNRKLEQFPEHILQLSQLRCLIVSSKPRVVATVMLPESLLNCAYWPNLTYIHIDVGEESVPLESQLIMSQLRTLLKSYNADCTLRYD